LSAECDDTTSLKKRVLYIQVDLSSDFVSQKYHFAIFLYCYNKGTVKNTYSGDPIDDQNVNWRVYSVYPYIN